MERLPEIPPAPAAGARIGRWLALFGPGAVIASLTIGTGARHMVLSGMHPFERYARLSGPRGWFPLTLLFLAAVAFPIWTGFVGGVLGTLLEGQFGLDTHLSGTVATGLAVLVYAADTRCWRGCSSGSWPHCSWRWDSPSC